MYEEKSLGVYASTDDDQEDDPNRPSYIGAHLRRQLSFDLWYVFLGLFIIAIAEGDRLQNTNQYAFTLYSVLFEIISAYGTVGLSLGYPNTDTSFSAEFSVISKLVIIAMQIRGRHRGLPYELDRAVLLPSEGLHRKEAEDAEKRLRRRNSTLSEFGGASTIPRADTTGRDSQRQPGGETRGQGEATGHHGYMNHTHLPEHHSHVRQGLGAGLARLAELPDVVESATKLGRTKERVD